MKSLLTIAYLALSFFPRAQPPVKWDFACSKKDKNSYELTFVATVKSPWHIYSQASPEGGPAPTSFHFNKNPLVVFDGAVMESGTIKEKFEEVFDVNVKYFEGAATFRQKVKLKGNARTSISGYLEYMVCNDEECYPPEKVNFNIRLD